MEIRIKHKIFGSGGYRWLTIKEEIEEGAIVRVSGNSGIGKTTFFHVLAGLLKPEWGYIKTNDTIFLDTENNIFLPPQKRDIALMFQQYALFPNMTLKENILYAQKVKNRAEVDRLLDTFELRKLQNRFPSELSGGQQQRTALARALAQNARILLLDEPFSAVDENMHKIMMGEISRFQQNNPLTVLVASHNSQELNKIASVRINLH